MSTLIIVVWGIWLSVDTIYCTSLIRRQFDTLRVPRWLSSRTIPYPEVKLSTSLILDDYDNSSWPHYALQSEWTFLQRAVSGCDDVYGILKVEMQCSLIPAIFAREILDRELGLF